MKTHTKQANDALSTCKMSKNSPSDGKNWGVSMTTHSDAVKIIYN